MKKQIALGLLAINMTGCAIIDTGHRGLKVKFGEVIGQPIEEGIITFNPLTDQIIEFETRTKKLQESTATYTQDVQKVSIQYAVNYNLKQTAVGDVYKTVGVDYENTLLSPILSGTIKDIVGKWDAVDLNAKRDQAASQVLEKLQHSLESKGITATDFQILDMRFDPEFENAVERKVTAIQRAEEAKNKTVQIQEESKQKIIAAEAEARAMSIKTQALAASPALVQYEAVQKWDGKLPTQMIPGSTVPFINIK